MSIMNTGLTGLKAATGNLEVIGNNIANANTFGFKQSYTMFNDIYAQGNSGASTGIGSGVGISSVQQDFSKGGTQLTDRVLDLSVQNDQFFVLKDQKDASSYTQAGQFFQDKDGMIVNSNGERLQGYQATNGVVGSALGDLQIDSTPLPARASTDLDFSLNLDASSSAITAPFNALDPSTYHFRTETTIYDGLGQAHSLSSYYTKSAANSWNVNVNVDGTSLASGALTFNTGGTLQTETGLNAIAWTPGNGAAAQTLDLGYGLSTQYVDNMQTRNINQDGYAAGILNSIEINDDGIIAARYSNGKTQNLGQVALADFASKTSLAPSGNMSWRETIASGQAVISPANSTGAIRSGTLESSNVDLTQQLVEMISAQRTFTANSQTIRAADNLFQTILNIR